MYDINVASGRAGQIIHEDNHDSLYCNNSIESKTIIGPEKKIRQGARDTSGDIVRELSSGDGGAP